MLKERIKNNKTVVGTWCEIPTPYATNVIASAGMDFVILDMEHGVIDFEMIQTMVFSAKSEQCGVFVRVPSLNEAHILRALDTGVDGIILPQVKSKKEVEKFIDYSKYYPIGNRGFNPYIKAGGYTGVDKNYFKRQNDRTILGIILEGKQALEEIEKIVSNENIDIVYLGQYDLSVALGVPGDVNNKLVTETIKKATKIINQHHKMAGCMVHSVKEAKNAMKNGIGFIVYKVDTGIMYEAYHKFKQEIK